MFDKFKCVTVVSVSGHNDGRFAAEAIAHTVQQLPGSSGLLMALQRPDNLPAHVRFVPLSRIDHVQYSLFVFHCLHYHIETEYALIVQDDGWALNGGNWRDEWFGYDYVGAPTHAAGVDGSLYSGFSWVGKPPAVQVMNGGFSLRSRRLLEAPARYGIGFRLIQNPVLLNEDIQICILARDRFESYGLAFAPLESALHFSAEFMHPSVHGNLDLTKLFGHHAPHRKLRANFVVEVNLTLEEIHRTYGERELLATLQKYGYTIRCR